MSKSVQLRGFFLVIYSRRGPWIINFVQTDLTCRKGTYLGSQGSALTNNNDHKKY